MKPPLKYLAVIAIITLLVSPAAQASMLVRYTFDEASSGTTTAINTGTLGGANGLFNGNATRTSNTPAGVTLGAYNLNPNGGNNDYVGPSSDLDALDSLSTLTVSTWLNVRSTLGYNYYELAGDQNWISGNGWDFYYTGSGNAVKLAFSVQTSATDANATINADNAWVFVAVTWDHSTGNLKFYSGTPGSAVTQVGTTVSLTPLMLGNTDALRVGANSSGGVERTPDAFMDDFRIYNTILDLTALDAVRQENLPEPATGLMLIFTGGVLLRRQRIPEAAPSHARFKDN